MKLIHYLFFFLLVSCSSQKNISGNYSFKTECIGIEMDGSQTLKSWGNGRNRSDAVEQAKKKALSDVLFQGVLEGRQGCEKRPLVPEVNARQNHEIYFNEFFTDNGEYLKYVSMKDERISEKIFRDKKGGEGNVTYGVVVRVLRSQLQLKLIKDGILKNN